jgi:hypothetical protein
MKEAIDEQLVNGAADSGAKYEQTKNERTEVLEWQRKAAAMLEFEGWRNDFYQRLDNNPRCFKCREKLSVWHAVVDTDQVGGRQYELNAVCNNLETNCDVVINDIAPVRVQGWV